MNLSNYSRRLPPSSSLRRMLQKRDSFSIEILIELVRPVIASMTQSKVDSNLRAKLDEDDIVQEACLELVKAIPRIQATTTKQFLAYIRQIVKNRLEDFRRRFLRAQSRSVKREISLDCAFSEEPLAISDHRFEPFERLIEQEQFDKLRSMLKALKPSVRKVLRMRFLKNMTWEEIGIRTNVDKDSIRIRVDRCLLRIRQELLSNVTP